MCMCVCVCVCVAQSCPTPTPWAVARQTPLSMRILQARILEWVAMPYSKGSSRPRSSALQVDPLSTEPPGNVYTYTYTYTYTFTYTYILYIYTHTHIYIHTFYIYTHTHTQTHMGFPGGAGSKVSACQFRRQKRSGFLPWVRKISGAGHGNLLQYSCLENPHGHRSLAGYSSLGQKELDTTEVV